MSTSAQDRRDNCGTQHARVCEWERDGADCSNGLRVGRPRVPYHNCMGCNGLRLRSRRQRRRVLGHGTSLLRMPAADAFSHTGCCLRDEARAEAAEQACARQARPLLCQWSQNSRAKSQARRAGPRLLLCRAGAQSPQCRSLDARSGEVIYSEYGQTAPAGVTSLSCRRQAG
jgi:hypothetical protein